MNRKKYNSSVFPSALRLCRLQQSATPLASRQGSCDKPVPIFGRLAGWEISAGFIRNSIPGSNMRATFRNRVPARSSLDDFYRLFLDPYQFQAAYGRIPRIKTVMSPERIPGIVALLRNERYRWSPVRRVLMTEPNGKIRPLGISTWRDKLVQEVMHFNLSPYFEIRFSPHSHGFRPGRSCHSALRAIFHTGKGTTWLVEGDIKNCFGQINHDIFLSIFSDHVHDRRLLTLVENLLRAGYLEEWDY